MRSDRFETIFQRDLDRLPGLADNEWLPRVRSRRRRFTASGLSALVALALMVIVIGLSLQAVRDTQQTVGEGAASNPPFMTTGPGSGAFTSDTGIIASNSLTGSPSCPLGQLPWIDVTHPPPPGSVPGTGSASASAAFRRARPAVTEFTMYAWGSSQPAQEDDPRIRGWAPVWIVAGSETYIAEAAGGSGGNNNWFAYPAKFMGCRTPPPAMLRKTAP